MRYLFRVVAMVRRNAGHALGIETLGIERVPESKRHGTSGRAFTVWFAANLGAPGFAIGVLIVLVFGLTLAQALPVLILSNLIGGALLGAVASMGPSLGIPQMMSSRSAFGRRGNYLLASLNWVSTIGWFTFNTIIGAIAILAIVPGFSLYAAVTALVAVQMAIAVLGHDMIHTFEKAMSLILGALFVAIFLLIVPHLGAALSYVPSAAPQPGAMLGAVGMAIAVAFSYIIAWSPYASDYSRYFSSKVSKIRVAVLAMLGAAAGSFIAEALGALVAAIIQNQNVAAQSATLFSGIASQFGVLGIAMLVALAIGVITANALNIYSNALSALVLDVKARRWVMVAVGGLLGLALAIGVGTNFAADFENFLLVLDYWITPWAAIMLVDFFVVGKTAANVRRPRSFDAPSIGIYLASIALSSPFMVPPGVCTAGVSNGCIVVPLLGSMSSLFGGADFSYFISFAIAAVAYYIYRMRPGLVGTSRNR